MRSYPFVAALLFATLGIVTSFVAAASAAPNLDRLQAPLSVVYVGELRDGGMLMLALSDSHGSGDGVLFNYKRGSVTQGRLYADGHLVPLGSAAQAQVLAAIQRYLDAEFTAVQQKDLAAGTLTAAARTYGERGYYACRLTRAVHRLNQLSAASLKA
jgi:hypothetical protein